ncbi:MAG: OmpA family protein [Pseudomonadota bacterium]
MLKSDSSPTSFLPALLTAAVAFGMSGCASVGNGLDEILDRTPVGDIEFSTEDEVDYQGASLFDPRFYATAGAGLSRLEPQTDNANGVSVADEMDKGGYIAAGADLSRTFSVELHAADLGSARLSPTGRIGYQIAGGSVLAYAGPQRAERQGFMGYGRAGVASTSIEGIGNVTFTSDSDPQALVGAGVEYMRNNLGVRGEIILFDKDAQFAQLGVVYRLGGGVGGAEELPESFDPTQPVPTAEPILLPDAQNQEPPLPVPPVTDQPLQQETLEELPPLAELPELPDLPELPELPPLAEETLLAEETPLATTNTIADNDADGIPDEFDSCPATDLGMEVDDSGCSIFNGVVDGVNFERGSSRLTAEARTVLDDVIATLRQHPDALISIAAHTDDRGNEDDNLALSRDRAISVARYLITRGIPKALMSARAFGEFQPIAENNSPEGRAMNRRVEIVASKQK